MRCACGHDFLIFCRSPGAAPSNRGFLRGEHQVPDQADHDEREGPPAQPGGQVLAQDRGARFREAAAAGDADAATAALQNASRQLDKAVSKGVIHKNQAANRKSAMAKQAASL